MLRKNRFKTLVVALTCFEVIRRIEIEQRQRLRWTAHVDGIRRQSVDAQPGCLLSSIGINFNPVAAGSCSFEQTTGRHAVSHAGIKGGELRRKSQTLLQLLGLKHG